LIPLFETNNFEDVCRFPVIYIQLLKYLDNNFIPVMPHERELRQVNDINYKIVEDVGKTDESRLMPTRRSRLKTESLDANTIQKKKELNDVSSVIESDDGSSTDELDSEDEKVIAMEKELKKLRARKQRKSYERKENLRKLEEKKEKLRQERKRSKSKDKGEAFSKTINLKDKYIKNNDKICHNRNFKKKPKI
jgi:hypothetical protein